MRTLYVAEGKALPSTSGPWSQAELRVMLGRLNPDNLEEPSKRLYDSIDFYLSMDTPDEDDQNLEMSLDVITRIRSYTHTNPESFDHVDKWGVPGYRIPVPVFAAELSLGFYDRIFLFMDPSIGLVRNFADPQSLKNAYSLTNIILLPPAQTLDTSANTPLRAYTSVGGNGWNVLLGREKVEWGPGHTGNFIFGSQVPYHDMLRVNAYTDKFKYTFITSFLIHPQNYFTNIADTSGGAPEVHAFRPHFGQSSWMNGISVYMHHRFEWRLFENLGLSVTEGILYQHPENYLDLRIINPMMIFHNLYMKQHANSLLNFDLDWTIVPGVNWYASVVIDDIALPFIENNPGVPGSTSPNSIGVLTGLNLVKPEVAGFWAGNVEFAYTDPYLYLRDRGLVKATNGEQDRTYGLSFMTGIREYGTEESSRYDLVWLGYRHGGDAIVSSADVQWCSYDGWGLGGKVFYMAHGVNDILSRWKPVGLGGVSEGAPSKGNNNSDDYFPTMDGDGNVKPHPTTDSISHTLVIGVNGYYSFAWNIISSAEMDFITVWNPDNLSTNPVLFDFQLSLGVTISH